LSGRVAVLTLLPFSLGESNGLGKNDIDLDDIIAACFEDLSIQGEDNSVDSTTKLDDWILRGSYPEIRANMSVDRKLWCSSYIQTYLERDVRQLINVGDLNTFSRFLRLCAALTGQMLNLSELARDVGVSVTTIKRWVSVLEASYQIYLLPPHFNNLGKRIIKSPKLYFLDTGLATFLMGLHAREPTLKGPTFGALFETMIVSEWVKAFCHRGEKPELYYWRSKSGLEIDLIVDRNGILYPMEIKSSSTIIPGHVKNLEKWQALAGGNAGNGILIANSVKPLRFKSYRVFPWSSGLDSIV
jgi:predicted AAA+ superfamily ATPase